MRRSKIWKVISLLVFLPLGLILIIFTVVNRRPVVVDFWPLPIDLTAPLSLIVMFSLVFGVIWGGLASWLTAAGRRRAKDVAGRVVQVEPKVSPLTGQDRSLDTDVKEVHRTISNNRRAYQSQALPTSKMT